MSGMAFMISDSYKDKLIRSHPSGLPCRKLPNQSILFKLSERQIAIDSPAQLYYRQKSLYQCVVPDYTETRVYCPPGYLRKFTPDGNRLLAFSGDQKDVLVYDYLGAGTGQGVYCSDSPFEDVKAELFSRFFRLKFSVSVASGGENLNRECSLFTDDGHYVIVGSSVTVAEEAYPDMYEIFRNNESVSPNIRFPLEDYSLHIVDMRGGAVTDSRTFKCDKIFLSHNQGLSLCHSTLAVLSVQHQTIYLFQVCSGLFIPTQEIGRFCYPDDDMLFSMVRFTQTNATVCSAEEREPDQALSPGREPYRPFLEKWYCLLKHRFLCWMMRQAEGLCTPGNQTPMTNFFNSYGYLSSLKLWKMQLLSEHHLLLKYASEDIVTMKQSDPTSQPAFFAVYDIESTDIIAVYENTSEELLRIYDNHADSFRAPISHPLAHDICSVANNVHAKTLHMKFKQTITNAKYGGRSEATRRLLGQLPMCAQSYSCSPYLDLTLFSYDDKWVSVLERPKPCGDSPVK